MLNQIRRVEVFGEVLRDLIFDTKGYGYGCYTCFDVREGFSEVSLDSELAERVYAIVYGGEGWYTFDINDDPDVAEEECRAEFANWTLYYNSEQDILAAWYWEGDGILLVKHGERWAINTDCKKAHIWESCKEKS